MKIEEAFAKRVARWEKLKTYFMPAKVQEAINKELRKHAPTTDDILKFNMDHEDWLVVSWVPVFYNWYGAETKDEAERISYIEASGGFTLNSVRIGPRSTIKIFPPKRGEQEFVFKNLDTVVRGILSSKRIEPDGDEFLLDTIMGDDCAPPSRDETAALVERMVDAMVEMGYSRRGAARTASKTVAAHPSIDNIDELLELAVNL